MEWQRLPVLLWLCLLPALGTGAEKKAPQKEDWAMYNYDLRGSRFNATEKTLNRENIAQLTEKWRFPPKGSKNTIGVVHATPSVVNGYVYFGTAINPTFYKLTPDGKVKWSYRNRDENGKLIRPNKDFLGFSTPGAIVSSALVTEDAVYFGDTGGYIFALDRYTGKELWKVNSRCKKFPDGHGANAIFSSPILANGKIIVAGGGFEHAHGAEKNYPCCSGRGFVLALEPKTGKLLWKYDVGPKPKKLDPPVKIKDAWGEHVFHYGPSTSSVWSTPSYDPQTKLIYFGTDVHNSPRQPTKKNPKLYTRHSSAVIALDVRNGKEKWLTQINRNDVWNFALRAYDPVKRQYKDQSIGDTPKIYAIGGEGKKQKVVGVGCKNGGFYVFDATNGKKIASTPIYTGPPAYPLKFPAHPRTLALPSPIGGLQTGCATDGKAVYTNGIDSILMGNREKSSIRFAQPTGGRVVSISLDTRKEHWRHERPLVPGVGGTKEKPAFTNVGDPVASGLALANGIGYFTTTVSNKLVAVDLRNGKALKETALGPVWSGPSVSRGRVYVGTGNMLFFPLPSEGYFPKEYTGRVISFGLPGEDAISKLGSGSE